MGLKSAHILDGGLQAVQVGMLGVPQPGLVHGQGHISGAGSHGLHLGQRFAGLHRLAGFIVDQGEGHFRQAAFRLFIFDFGGHLQISRLRRAVGLVFDLFRIPGQPAEGYMQLGRMDQFHTPEQARAGEPAGVRLHAGVHGDDDAILLPRIDQMGDVRLKGRVAVMLQTRQIAVDLHGGVHHNPVETQENRIVFPIRGDVDLLSEMGHARVVIAAGPAGCRFRENVAFDHIIMGQIDFPISKNPADALSQVHLTQTKIPFPIDFHAAHGCILLYLAVQKVYLPGFTQVSFPFRQTFAGAGVSSS